MSLIPLRPVLEATAKYGYAQGAFNVNAVAQAKAAVEVHEQFRSAAVLQGPTWPTALWADAWIFKTPRWRIRFGAPGTSATP
jgi:fructose/tagatose bisphosphate aldolase